MDQHASKYASIYGTRTDPPCELREVHQVMSLLSDLSHLLTLLDRRLEMDSRLAGLVPCGLASASKYAHDSAAAVELPVKV